jgi:phosphopantetheinyl transferase (holo-ACP synthase)
VSTLDDVRWTPAVRRLIFTDAEWNRFAIETAPTRFLNQLFAIKEACVKACSGAVLPPQIEVAVGMSRARMVSRRGEIIPVSGSEFTVSASTSKTGLTLAIAFRNANLELNEVCEA